MLTSLLRHRVDWERPFITTDDALGSQRTFQKHQSNVRCLIQPVSSKEQLLFAQRQLTVSHFLFFDRLLDVQAGDRFLHRQRPGSPPRYFVVNGREDQGGQDGRCFCVRAYEQV